MEWKWLEAATGGRKARKYVSKAPGPMKDNPFAKYRKARELDLHPAAALLNRNKPGTTSST